MKSDWSKLNTLQLGKYAEYLTKMAFTRVGLDVYTAEVDDKGIDFVIRKSESEHLDVQVKSIRSTQYIYMTKDKFKPSKNLLLALVIFEMDSEPILLLIPSLDWTEDLKNENFSFLMITKTRKANQNMEYVSQKQTLKK
jgi:hypothetical protein